MNKRKRARCERSLKRLEDQYGEAEQRAKNRMANAPWYLDSDVVRIRIHIDNTRRNMGLPEWTGDN